MEKTNIMVVANHPEILATILRLINKNEHWEGMGAHSFEEAVKTFQIRKFDLVLLGVGVDQEMEQQLVTLLRSIQPGVICIRHFGGGSGLLYSEIQQALTEH